MEKLDIGLKNFASSYYEFTDNEYRVTIASPKGGKPPLDPKSLQPDNQTEYTKRLQDDKKAKEKLENTKRLSEIYPEDYDTLFLPGGHGPMWDLSQDKDLKKIVEYFYNGKKLFPPFVTVPQGNYRQRAKMGLDTKKQKSNWIYEQ